MRQVLPIIDAQHTRSFAAAYSLVAELEALLASLELLLLELVLGLLSRLALLAQDDLVLLRHLERGARLTLHQPRIGRCRGTKVFGVYWRIWRRRGGEVGGLECHAGCIRGWGNG